MGWRRWSARWASAVRSPGSAESARDAGLVGAGEGGDDRSVGCGAGDEVRLIEADEVDEEVDIGMGRQRIGDRIGGRVLDRVSGAQRADVVVVVGRGARDHVGPGLGEQRHEHRSGPGGRADDEGGLARPQLGGAQDRLGCQAALGEGGRRERVEAFGSTLDVRSVGGCPGAGGLDPGPGFSQEVAEHLVADRKAGDAVAGGDHGAGGVHGADARSAVRRQLRHDAGAERVVDVVQAARLHADEDLAGTGRRRLPVAVADVLRRAAAGRRRSWVPVVRRCLLLL
jgi:hypothetical protein